jgi:hypothetical protein
VHTCEFAFSVAAVKLLCKALLKCRVAAADVGVIALCTSVECMRKLAALSSYCIVGVMVRVRDCEIGSVLQTRPKRIVSRMN